MSSHKFPVNHRLVHAHEFDRVFKECEFRIGNPALLFLAKPNHRGFNRLGMVVSKKSVPLAVDRNRIKRQIRETFRKTLTDTPVCLDVVVLTRSKVRTAENLNGILADSFTNLLKRAENPGDKA
ncbi:MAG: ribonuclease P protein component [Pseudomonadales bacterium]|nr:ribonuclease P protein component [Pseudomonadales bacterium]MBO7006113.1 ribonuclease P protein component [Pseudomonadales bacterium]